MGPASLASLVMSPVHCLFGLHIVRRGVIFIDLAVAQIAALGMVMAIRQGYDAHSPQAYWWSLGFAFAALAALVKGPQAPVYFGAITVVYLAVMRDWKAQGICRYIGVTHSQDQSKANPRLIDMLQKEKLDFIQVNYSLAERSVEDKLLAVAADTGTAVMCNLPFARAALFKAVAGKAVPDWAKEFDAPSWGQFFLKYLLAREEVNLVIPGTDRVEHMQDNLDAARTRLPNAAQRKRMVEFIGAA